LRGEKLREIGGDSNAHCPARQAEPTLGVKMDNNRKHHAKGEQGNRQIVEQKSALTIEETGYLHFRFLERPRKRES
jgi:hypothetical protein